MRYVAAQCYAGGMKLGVAQAGFELQGSCELPPAPGFASPLPEANRHLLGNSWQTHVGTAADWPVFNAELLISNPPCSGFSGMTVTAKGFHGASSPINHCMWETMRYAARCFPEIVIMESVQNAFTKGRELMQLLRLELETLTGEAYNLTHVKHNVASLGGGCVRRRYFFVATRAGLNFDVEYPKPDTRGLTLRETIGDLLHVSLGWDGLPDGHDIVHRVNRENQQFADLIDYWREGDSISDAAWNFLNSGNEHLPTSFRKKDEVRLRERGSWYFMQPNRWTWERPGKVIDGGSFTRILHPLLPRTITFREGARIMGFPDDWTLRPIIEHRGGEQWLGKGVTVTAARWIGEAARLTLEGVFDSPGGELIGDRERLIWVK